MNYHEHSNRQQFQPSRFLKNRKKKIGLFLDARPSYGGAYQYNLSISEAVASLNANRYDTVVAYTDKPWASILNGLNLPNIYIPLGIWKFMTLKRIAGRFPIGFWRNISPIFHRPIKEILKQQCDLWIFPSQDTLTYLTPVNSLGTIYDLMHRYEPRFPEVSAFGRYAVRERHFKNMCHWSKGLLVDSEVGKQHVIESYGMAAGRIYVLPYVAPKYIYTRGNGNELDRRYNLPDKYIFSPAQFWRHKNHANLLLAMKKLSNRYPDMNLVLSGSPEKEYDQIRKMAQSLGFDNHVRFLSYVPNEDMAEIYCKARALIMPTYFGPTNIPPLEAAACSCPMAISDIYGMRAQMGEAAIYFDPSSVEQISECMEQLWTKDELCKELAIEGIKKATHWKQTDFNRAFSGIIDSICFQQKILSAEG